MKGSLLKWTQKLESVKSSGSIDAEGTSHEQQFEKHSSSSNDSEQPRDSDNEQTDIEEQYDAAIAARSEEEFETLAANTTSNLPIFNDVSSWHIPVPDSVRTDIIKRGSEPFQNKQGPFKSVKRSCAKVKGELRQLSAAWFYYSLSNGDRVLRSWMANRLVNAETDITFFGSEKSIPVANRQQSYILSTILLYKANVMEEKLKDMKQQMYAWEEKNERHLARNKKLKSEQNILMERLLEQSRIVEKTWEDEEIIEKTAVLETLQEKRICAESTENELQELQKQITEVEKEIEVLKKETDYWTLYREKEQFYHATYIEVLKQQIRNMNTSFSYLHGFLTEKLAKDKNTIHQDMTNKLDDHKIEATELAIRQIPKQYKQEIQDNDWLKQETMEQLFEYNANDLKIVRNLSLNQCSEFDDIQASPGILEMDLTRLDENYSHFPALIYSPDDIDNIYKTVFLMQEDPMDFMKLGPIEWKLLAVCGKPAPLHIPKQKTQQELNVLKQIPSDWPVTKSMLQCLKTVSK
ncbi:unnamed protein product [Acanthosepion pharaonis]|uniref:Uncharacterized protein n=1 Tax=Acanthosepion pharaonis TaxID=158019 RepID=A0A812BRB3_ACAPH|nr:unnamed protein product [Sepia pharaonis]